MKRCLLLICVASVAAAATPRTLAKLGLLDVGFGPTIRLLGVADPPAVLPFAIGEVAVGVMVSDRVGVGLGTTIVAGNLMWDISSFPVRAYAFYDISPTQRWRKGAGFLCATYVHSGQTGWNGSGLVQYLTLAGGVSYTFYAVTPHAELGYDWHERFATLTVGVAIGGTYFFR
jgi:hypothetical protein